MGQQRSISSEGKAKSGTAGEGDGHGLKKNVSLSTFHAAELLSETIKGLRSSQELSRVANTVPEKPITAPDDSIPITHDALPKLKPQQRTNASDDVPGTDFIAAIRVGSHTQPAETGLAEAPGIQKTGQDGTKPKLAAFWKNRSIPRSFKCLLDNEEPRDRRTKEYAATINSELR